MLNKEIVEGYFYSGEEILNEPGQWTKVISENRDWFYKSDYWNRWSRVLWRPAPSDSAVEVSIEPLNYVDLNKNYGTHDLKELLDLRIRKHRTAYQHPEKFTHVLPGSFARYVQEIAGEYFYHLLFHEDLYSQIDWEKYEAQQKGPTGYAWGGGGVPFILCCKDRDKYPELLRHWFTNVMKNVDNTEKRCLDCFDDDMKDRYRKFLDNLNNPKELFYDRVPANWIEHYKDLLEMSPGPNGEDSSKDVREWMETNKPKE